MFIFLSNFPLEKKCHSFPGSKILIVAEYYSEIVNLENAMTCSVVKEYPQSTNGAVGGNLGSTPVVCGGYGDAGIGSTDKCYAYIKSPSSNQGHGNLCCVLQKYALSLASRILG